MRRQTVKLTNERTAMRVSLNTIVVNVVLAGFKLFAGFFAHSQAMLSDAVHTLSDVFSTLIVMIGIKLANRESDANHQYGHERFECIAAILLAAVLAATGIGIGYGGVVDISAAQSASLSAPGPLALIAALTSILVKESMYRYTRAAAKRIDSGALMADAWHHRSDALSSVGSLAGVGGAMLGMPILDPIASLLICVFILKAAFDIFMDAVRKLTDEAVDEKTANSIRGVIQAQQGVLGIDKLSTRLFADKLYVDVEIRARSASTLLEAHNIAERVHDEIERAFPKTKHCMVHVNPDKSH